VVDVKVGDEVVLSAGWFCGRCQACLEGRENHCRRYHLFGEHRRGAAAEYFVAPERNVLPKPPSISWEEAAAVGVTFLTAWHMLVTRGRLRLGETVLVHGASSGVGVAGIQVAKLVGARVIATTSSGEKAERARELGADETIDYTREDVRERVKALTDREMVDVVFEHLGGEVFETSIRCVKTGGRIITCGATAGPTPTLDLRYVFARQLEVLGATMGTRAELSQVLRWIGARRILAVIDRVLPLEEIAEGHRLLEEKAHFGKIVHTP
jgi:NADPH:quinone reductase-like Zn-dependent oxidoreductase